MFHSEEVIHVDLSDFTRSRWFIELTVGFTPSQLERYTSISNRTMVINLLLPLQAPIFNRYPLLVASTHLVSMPPSTPMNLDVNAFQAALAMEAIDIVKKKQRTSAGIILAGDFNTQPSFAADLVERIEALSPNARSSVKLAGSEESEVPCEDAIATDCRHNQGGVLVACARATTQSFGFQEWLQNPNGRLSECMANPYFMQEACMASCQESRRSRSELRRLLCNLWAALGDCTVKDNWMRTHCPAHCDTDASFELSHATAKLTSPAYEVITKGSLSDHSIALLAVVLETGGLDPSKVLPLNVFNTSWKLNSLRSVHAELLPSEPATCLQQTLDYIFYSPGYSVQQLSLRGVLAPPKPLNLQESIMQFGSDHVPLIADLAIVTKTAKSDPTQFLLQQFM